MAMIPQRPMSEYALYLATVLLVVISIVASRVTFDTPDQRTFQHATIEHASSDGFYPK